jgi:5-methylcytosine-specific restriction endonuclease McrA
MEEPAPTKVCSKCGRELPLDMYCKAIANKDGISTKCRDCRTEEHRQWRAKHRGEKAVPPSEGVKSCTKCHRKLTVTEFYMNGRYLMAYCKDCWRERVRQRYEECPESTEHRAERWKRYTQANPEHFRIVRKAQKAIRRSRELGCEGNFTPNDIAWKLFQQDNKCAYCHQEFSEALPCTIDHIVPLSRGGTNWPSNLAMACGPCNSRKHDKMPDEFSPLEGIAA